MNYDIEFQVPFRHRVRFTTDLVGNQLEVLVDLIDAEELEVAKVLVVSDRALADVRTGGGEGWLTHLESQLAQQPKIHLLDANEFNSLDRTEKQQPSSIALLNGGEDCKNDPQHIERLLKMINHFDIDRRSYIVAVGGGAVLDAVGYAAAIAHRGIRLIRVPTTTLAQDDSGVGVKNAVNYFQKKNWIGTFAVPWGVINDAKILESLPDRDFRCGFSEAVKVSLLKSREDFEFLCQNAQAIFRRQMDVAFETIKRSCVWHLKHITQGGDPFEALEARPLDFGHWSAHKMESMTEFSIRHGEAVGIGVAIDCIYSQRMYGFSENDVVSVLNCLQDLGIELWHPILEQSDQLLQGLEEFRQHLGGRLTVTMLDGIGSPINVHQVDETEMRLAIQKLKAWQSKECSI